MMLFDFETKLKRVNPMLRVIKTTPARFAGIEMIGKEADGAICGVSKLGLTPNQSIIDNTGHLKIRSVRDVLFILVGKKCIDKDKAQRVFDIKLDKRHPAIREE